MAAKGEIETERHNRTVRTSGKAWRCERCGRYIQPGERYSWIPWHEGRRHATECLKCGLKREEGES